MNLDRQFLVVEFDSLMNGFSDLNSISKISLSQLIDFKDFGNGGYILALVPNNDIDIKLISKYKVFESQATDFFLALFSFKFNHKFTQDIFLVECKSILNFSQLCYKCFKNNYQIINFQVFHLSNNIVFKLVYSVPEPEQFEIQNSIKISDLTAKAVDFFNFN